MYSNIPKNRRIIREVSDVEVINNYIDGAYVEVKSSRPGSFRVEIRNSRDEVEYATKLSENMWCKTNKKYAEEYRCTVWEESTGKCLYDRRYNPSGKRVYIALDSKSIGDTMAWFPYAEEYRKKWGCKVICSTFWNSLFVDQYPEIEFVEPGAVVHNIYAQYRIGLYFKDGRINYDMHRKDPTKVSLLELCSDILGLEYREVRPALKMTGAPKKKRVGIGFHSTAQAKYWNNPEGWQELTDFLISKGYEVVILSKEEDGYMGNFFPRGSRKLVTGGLESLMEYMQTCEFFIGISSGLSWLAWSLGLPTVLISGFTGENLEPRDGVVRISNKSVCNDCWSRHKFDPGDWNWCPDHKGTARHFECSKSITGSMVIDRIKAAGLVSEDRSEENERMLDFLSKDYDIIEGYSGDWVLSKGDILLIKKKES